jgi:hypothetical protein
MRDTTRKPHTEEAWQAHLDPTAGTDALVPDHDLRDPTRGIGADHPELREPDPTAGRSAA